jgi:DtxR family Mn-dependent transcriptional regulator
MVKWVVRMGRERKLSASLEDYLEAIYNLAEQSRVPRSKDIAQELAVSRASVTGALRLLREKGMIHYEPYDHATLTRAGRAAARDVVARHNILKSFFINVLGLPAEVAQQAACRAEHALGQDVIGRFLAFVEFVGGRDTSGARLADEFRDFCAARAGRKGAT